MRNVRQPTMTPSAGAWKFRFGADISASDGTAGKLIAVAVVADKQGQTLTYLGIRVRLFSRHHYFVPVEVVTGAGTERVTLNIALAEIEKWPSAPSGSGIVLSRSTRMNTIDARDSRDARDRGDAAGKRLGLLVQITVDPVTHALRSFVVARGWRGEVLVPVRAVTNFAARQVTAHLGNRRPDDMPYRPDEQLRQDIYDRLFDHAPLRLDLAAIEIHPLDGVVQLRGHVTNDLLRRMAEDQIQGITGMSELHNDLVADNDLAARVSMALALDSRTTGQHIGVYPHLGEIHLRGSVRTRAAYEGASTVAGAVPAVTRIMNELRIDPDANEISVLAGVTNREDLVPGGR
jgi:osmotically-inducible protein OsmY